ncbi:MAG: DNA double-strand break repair nuclease NurA [Chloroflexi bacterium]|nr:DNA double-strand break repair nuclease NurA [Chloroflexota bacterium]
MPVDFIKVRDQITQIGKTAPKEAKRLKELGEKARQLLDANSGDIDRLRDKVTLAAKEDQFLRCAKPVSESLNAAFSLPPLPETASILAADGSQINPDSHAAVNYYLINVGAISLNQGSSAAPIATVQTDIFFGEDIYTTSGTISENLVALKRDQRERQVLAELAQKADAPTFTLTDGPMELWGGKGQTTDETKTFSQALEEYKKALKTLHDLGAATAGYVDKPRAGYVVQLLEVAATHRDELKELRENRPLRGVSDSALFRSILDPGERSAIFAIQSKSSKSYEGDLALHFFYLNVGRKKKPWLARVEIPAWVVNDETMLNNLHAVLIDQCRIMGSRAYPYLLHRSHEVAVVTREEKEQITEMLVQELNKQHVEFGEISQKQAAKNFSGRRRFTLGSKRY